MTLATHIVIAAAVTKPLTLSPFIGFFIGVISHYLSDAIPHWDYRLHSILDKGLDAPSEDKRTIDYALFVKDIRNTALDFFIGLGVALFLFWPITMQEFLYVLLVSFGGVLPDFLQGVYFTGKAPFLKPVQKFHDLMHTDIKLGRYPLIGIPLQAVIVLISLLFLF